MLVAAEPDDIVLDSVDEELAKVNRFRCTCKYDKGHPCYSIYQPQEVVDTRMKMAEFTPREQMLVFLGKLSTFMNLSDTVLGVGRIEKAREHQRMVYYVNGHQLCRETFKFMHAFDAASPGVVFMKAARDSPEEQFRLMGDSDTSLPSTPPVAIEPPGLSHDRQQYLHTHIRPFVKEEWKDVLCPRPTERADSPVAGPSTAPEAGPSTAVASAVRRGGKRGRGRPPRQPSPSPTQPARKRTRGRGRGGAGRGRGGAGRGRGSDANV
ncbi:hypothetical protein NP493_1265g00054 [Ridgeia piscesae]|uniref:Uncharacterized protein n=1 Tax=Ridgeia piscesae TaxID=27915 RepID=A0AAD9K9S4_RIDPI|nr:hypothetical protein NP493_1265g00054 [Ridgeia piscesae]